MKQKISKIVSIILVLTMMMSTVVFAKPTQLDVKMNGSIVGFTDAFPFINSDNRTMTPLRMVCESMGATVEWYPDGSISVQLDDVFLSLQIGSNKIKVIKDGQESTVVMDTEAIIKNDRTFIPIRFVAEAFGQVVDYDPVTMTVLI